jgi:hypothetical protein
MLDGGGWLASHFSRFSPEEDSPVGIKWGLNGLLITIAQLVRLFNGAVLTAELIVARASNENVEVLQKSGDDTFQICVQARGSQSPPPPPKISEEIKIERMRKHCILLS